MTHLFCVVYHCQGMTPGSTWLEWVQSDVDMADADGDGEGDNNGNTSYDDDSNYDADDDDLDAFVEFHDDAGDHDGPDDRIHAPSSLCCPIGHVSQNCFPHWLA